MEIFNFILHIDIYLASTIDLFGSWIYVFLFLVVFAETGLIVTPFLPGDSLLFAVGSFAGGGYLNFWIAYIAMFVAAVLGDAVNYSVGLYIGPRVFFKEDSRFFKKEYLDKTRKFYEKYGGKTIVLARFLPIIRTFAPFVAGIGKMEYRLFAFYNIFGAFIWVSSLMAVGYFFGGLPIIKENFELAILVIIFISLLPMFFEYVRFKS